MSPMNDKLHCISVAIQSADSLPTLPAVAMSVLRLSQDPRVSIERLAEAIENDPALAAKTLRFANSSYYGASKPIASLPQAIVRIGIRGTKLLALSFSLLDTFKASSRDFDYTAFWHRSIVAAVAARRIAQHSTRSLVDEAFVTGLLVDIGCPILARTFPTEYRQVWRRFYSAPQPLSELETNLVGVSHPEAGRLLAQAWKLPSTIVAAIGAHDDPQSIAQQADAFPVAVIVAAADRLTDILVRGTTVHRVEALTSLFRRYFAFQPRHLNVILSAIEPEIASVGQMLDVSLPPADQLQAEAKSEMLRLAMIDAGATAEADTRPSKTIQSS